jgi:hypothetical protein
VAESFRLIGVAGKAGAGKDTFYEHVLKPRGFLRWPMTLHYKVWLYARGYAWEDVFYHKPPQMRQILQQEITALRYEHGEDIWLNTLTAWMRALREIVGVQPAVPASGREAPHWLPARGHAGIAVTDLRFLIEMRGIKMAGGKILHLEAPDQQAHVAPELRGHRSEVELDRPEVKMLRDSYVFNEKNGIDRLTYKGERMRQDWGWL